MPSIRKVRDPKGTPGRGQQNGLSQAEGWPHLPWASGLNGKKGGGGGRLQRLDPQPRANPCLHPFQSLKCPKIGCSR